MRRVVAMYPYVDTEVILHGDKSVVYVIEPLCWERNTLVNGYYTLDGALTKLENAELLRVVVDCKKLMITLRKILGRAEFENLIRTLVEEILEENKKADK